MFERGSDLLQIYELQTCWESFKKLKVEVQVACNLRTT